MTFLLKEQNQFAHISEFGLRPTYEPNSSFSAPAEIMMVMITCNRRENTYFAIVRREVRGLADPGEARGEREQRCPR